MQSVKYLDQAISKLGLKNDSALAKHFGWSSGAMSQYRAGKRVMDDEACLAVAMALELDEGQTMRLLMAAGMDRAEKAGQQSLWSVFSQRMAATAASALLATGVTLFLTPENAEAAPVKATSKLEMNTLYIM